MNYSRLLIHEFSEEKKKFLNLYNIELLGGKVGWLEVVNFKRGEHVSELSVKKFVFKMHCNLALH